MLRLFMIPALSTALLWQSPAAAESMPSTSTSLTHLRSALDDFLAAQSTLRVRTKVTSLVRISNGRLSEKNYHIDCVIKHGVAKLSQYGEGIIDGEKQWFDIRETLLFPSGETAEWRHPGFPGQLSFGTDSNHANRIGYDANRLGHPLFTLNMIRRVLAREASEITSESESEIVVRTSPFADPKHTDLATDYLEIVFSRQSDDLPISLTRIMPDDDPTTHFHSGASIQIEYGRAKDDSVILLSAKRDWQLRDDVEGKLHTKWDFETFDRSAKTTIDDVRLTLPIGILAENVDSGRRFTVTGKDDDSAVTLKKRFGDYVQFAPRAAAMKAIAASFVGQCPDLPREYHSVSEPYSQSGPAPTTSRGIYRGIAGHVIALLGIGAFWRRRRAAQKVD